MTQVFDDSSFELDADTVDSQIEQLWFTTQCESRLHDVRHSARGGARRLRQVTPKLVSRWFVHAPDAMKLFILAHLLKPLTALSVSGVAAGVFARFQNHRPRIDNAGDLDAVSRLATQDIEALTAFVDEVDPAVVDDLALWVVAHANDVVACRGTTAMLQRRLTLSTPEVVIPSRS
jgi:hypothetical protein